MAIAFAALAVWDAASLRQVCGMIAAVFAATAALRPQALARLNRLWTKLGLALGKVIGPLIMGLIFFVVVTPLGLIRRLTGGDPLRLKRDQKASSYWIARSEPSSMKDQF